MRVVLYCPDRHLVYDGRTPDEVGVGGGVTARVRMGRALGRLGHDVTQVVNCPRRERIDGVEYLPLDDVPRLEADVILFNTSGSRLDLSPALALQPSARLKIVWAHGTQRPGGLDRLAHDVIYAVSNFVARLAVDEWGIAAAKVFVSYNGYEAAHFDGPAPDRDPYQLIYFSHPSKGLETARAVLSILRATDPRYHLEVAGGMRLWGGADEVAIEQEGVRVHGLLGQRQLVPLLNASAYSLQLQDREEPFGLAVIEAMRAGAVVIASPVGALAELIHDTKDGILVPGDHRTVEARQAAAERILWLGSHPEALRAMARRARQAALDTDTLALAWAQHWETLLGIHASPAVTCSQCGGSAMHLADGEHCRECAHFSLRRDDGAGR